MLPESFLELEGFDATVGRPKQEQGPGKSQADGADQARSSQTGAEYITDTVPAVVVAVVPLVKLEKARSILNDLICFLTKNSNSIAVKMILATLRIAPIRICCLWLSHLE